MQRASGMRVTSKAGNLHFEFGHAGPLGSRVIRYVHDGRTDEQKQRLLPPSYGWRHNNLCSKLHDYIYVLNLVQFCTANNGHYTECSIKLLTSKVFNIASPP